MDAPKQTLKDLRDWMVINSLPDTWWACNRVRIHGPMSLEELERDYLNAGCKPLYAVHTIFTENHPWVEVVLDVSKLKKTNAFTLHKTTNTSALNKCWSRKPGAIGEENPPTPPENPL